MLGGVVTGCARRRGSWAHTSDGVHRRGPERGEPVRHREPSARSTADVPAVVNAGLAGSEGATQGGQSSSAPGIVAMLLGLALALGALTRRRITV